VSLFERAIQLLTRLLDGIVFYKSSQHRSKMLLKQSSEWKQIALHEMKKATKYLVSRECFSDTCVQRSHVCIHAEKRECVCVCECECES